MDSVRRSIAVMVSGKSIMRPSMRTSGTGSRRGRGRRERAPGAKACPDRSVIPSAARNPPRPERGRSIGTMKILRLAARDDTALDRDDRNSSPDGSERTWRLKRPPRRAYANRLGVRIRNREKILTRIDELVSLDVVLLVVQLPITTIRTQQLAMRTALDDPALFHHQDL